MKTCAICKKIKPTDSFHGKGSYCKPCQSAFHKKWRAENSTQLKRKKAWAYRQQMPRDKWNAHLRSRYGITADDYERMFAEQNGVCAICFNPSIHKRLSVDHCHQTGAIRGLLCDRCNTVLGRVDDNREILLRAAEYLRPKVKLAVVGK